MKWYKSNILKKLFLETTDWNVAWKKVEENVYSVIENPDGYWLADSLIYSCDEGVFLFVEAFDKHDNIGKLAVLKYNGKEFSDFKIIMEKEYHLSYPYVFKFNNEYYMIPETSANNSIEIYKSYNFPYDWKKEKELLKGKYVDTTVFEFENKFILYSYDILNHMLITGELNMTNLEIINIETKLDKLYQLRAGGNVYQKNGKYYRAIQNNEFFYGQKLDIINCFDNNKVGNLNPVEISNNKNIVYRRLHTYSKSDNFEAVDLSDFRFNIFKIFKKIKGVIKK